MKTLRTKFVYSLLSAAVLLNACSENRNGNVNSSASNSNRARNAPVEIVVQDNIEDLDKIVKLPYLPVEATYTETNTNGTNNAPNEKRFVGVLQFAPEDAARLIADAAKYKSPAPSDVDAETWFPPEMVAKSQETGDEFLKGTEYAANDFLQPPYLNGKLTRVNDTNYFVLELNSF